MNISNNQNCQYELSHFHSNKISVVSNTIIQSVARGSTVSVSGIMLVGRLSMMSIVHSL